jgi:hypothetical protein
MTVDELRSKSNMELRERCAWYVAERGECAVKVIATR